MTAHRSSGWRGGVAVHYIDVTRRIVSAERTGAADTQLGLVLTFVAGATNAGGVLALGQYTSHMSGIFSAMADNLALGAVGLVLIGLAALSAFVGMGFRDGQSQAIGSCPRSGYSPITDIRRTSASCHLQTLSALAIADTLGPLRGVFNSGQFGASTSRRRLARGVGSSPLLFIRLPLQSGQPLNAQVCVP